MHYHEILIKWWEDILISEFKKKKIPKCICQASSDTNFKFLLMV